MGRNPEQTDAELRKIRRLLRETVRLAEQASLTGSLSSGSRIAIRQYNSIREHLQDHGRIPEDLFPELDEDEATFDELGVVSSLLDGYLMDEDTTPPPPMSAGPGAPGFIFNAAPDLKDLEELREIGQAIREHFPDWLKTQAGAKKQTAASEFANLTDLESRVAEIGAKLQAVAEQLRRGDLSDEQRAELAEQLSQLGQEQARLARQRALLRERQER